jgi:hypothetical protein
MVLSRDEFNKRVFERDNFLCVIPGCGQKAVDAHHIIERKVSEIDTYLLIPTNSNGYASRRVCMW